MNQTSKIFNKDERTLLHEILSGTAYGTKGVPIQRFLAKLQAGLAEKGIELTKEKINSIIYWKTNNQDVWNEVFALVELERPGLWERLRQLTV